MVPKVFKLALFRAALHPRTPKRKRQCHSGANKANKLTELTAASEAKNNRSKMAEVKVKRETNVPEPAEVENRSEKRELIPPDEPSC